MTEPNDFMKSIYKEIGGSDTNQDVHDWLSTGVLPLNKAISGSYSGGIPVGRVTECMGASSSGKSLLATMVSIETQKRDGLVVFLDYEHAFSVERAKRIGLTTDPNKWIYKQPNSAEEGFKIIEKVATMVRDNDIDKYVTIVIDSVASMPTLAEVGTDYDKLNMKTNLALAAMLSASLKKLVPIINKTNTTLFMINQLRDNPGVMYGPKDKTPGGNALKYYASVRIKIKKGQKIEEGKEIVGELATASTIKNKVYAPFKECEYRGSFTEGIDLVGTHIDYAAKIGLLGGAKGWVMWNDEKMRRADLTSILKADKEQYEKFLELFTDEVIDPETGEVTNA